MNAHVLLRTFFACAIASTLACGGATTGSVAAAAPPPTPVPQATLAPSPTAVPQSTLATTPGVSPHAEAAALRPGSLPPVRLSARSSPPRRAPRRPPTLLAIHAAPRLQR